MATLKERIIVLLKSSPGLTDREIMDELFGVGVRHQAAANQAARELAASGLIRRQQRQDGKIGNYPSGSLIPEMNQPSRTQITPTFQSEDEVKRKLQQWLLESGWQVDDPKWGYTRGIDIEAFRDGIRWIIEVKGSGSRNAMRVNYFLATLGELLQRMNDPNARYSIALPDMEQFRRLWQRLPNLAKSRTTISALFVDASGYVEEID